MSNNKQLLSGNTHYLSHNEKIYLCTTLLLYFEKGTKEPTKTCCCRPPFLLFSTERVMFTLTTQCIGPSQMLRPASFVLYYVWWTPTVHRSHSTRYVFVQDCKCFGWCWGHFCEGYKSISNTHIHMFRTKFEVLSYNQGLYILVWVE